MGLLRRKKPDPTGETSPAVEPPPEGDPGFDLEADLKQLDEQHAAGELSDDEVEDAKRRLLGG